MHTPLPWKAVKINGVYCVSPAALPWSDEIPIAECRQGGFSWAFGHVHGEEDRCRQNAILIANAVNAHDELLEACMNAQGAYEALKLLGADTHLPGYESCVDKLNTAIAKATTETD